ncbi:hypothetical protein Bcp1_013 [Bacillus phage Bcp1]|uniref:Uncharacterized protein n=1 Tax=Bacillus phage Bcp1 TaxID=584892 RepID=X2JKZ4_9CAUD|nr:hypothetical protein Bcp1_013 [Bacillus phage Bcp1]AHN66490.1 hypothetical protein Bcp1_013 [Bacillus phage Bcp1]
MTKTYKGFEALERMMDGWIKKENTAFNIYRFEDGVVKAKSILNGKYINTTININLFFNNTFVDYVEPLAVGDTVKVKLLTGELFGEVGQVFDEWGKTWFRFKGNNSPYNVDNAIRIEKEELDLLKREATFKAAGRQLDEFRKGDIVEITKDGDTFTAEVRQQGGGSAKMVEYVGLRSGYKYGCDVKPIKFVTFVDATHPDYVKVNPVAPCTAPMMPGMAAPIPPMMGGRL